MKHPEPQPLPKDLLRQEISLYRELLDCLEQEAQALAKAQEENILSLAASKEEILEQLLGVKQARGENPPAAPENKAAFADLGRLQRQVAVLNLRNREIITASLEVIQEYIDQFLPPGPGLYQQEGQVEAGSGRTLFHRQA